MAGRVPMTGESQTENSHDRPLEHLAPFRDPPSMQLGKSHENPMGKITLRFGTTKGSHVGGDDAPTISSKLGGRGVGCVAPLPKSNGHHSQRDLQKQVFQPPTGTIGADSIRDHYLDTANVAFPAIR
jgi:hypothetical protein